ncbi:MAG: TolC family protein [Oligoflexia bacterium]
MRHSHEGYLAAARAQKAAQERRAESHLVFSPKLLVEARQGKDSRPQLIQFAPEATRSTNLSTLLDQPFEFGLDARLGISFDRVNITLPPQGAQAFLYQNYYDARPSVELSLPLLGGSNGKLLKAKRDSIRESADASQNEARYVGDSIVRQSELLYWQTSAIQEELKIREAHFERSRRRILWMQKRHKSKLADSSDLLQVDLQASAAELALAQAQEKYEQAQLQFNAARSLTEIPTLPALEPLGATPGVLDPSKKPIQIRADLQAKRHRANETVARQNEAKEQLRSKLELFGNFSLWGRDSTVGSALSQSLSLSNPIWSVGVRLEAPLFWKAQSSALNSTLHEQARAELELSRSFIEYQRDYELQRARHLEALQRTQKLEWQLKQYTRMLELAELKLKQARTTTFELLSLEDQASTAKLLHLAARLELKEIELQLRSYLESPPEA